MNALTASGDQDAPFQLVKRFEAQWLEFMRDGAARPTVTETLSALVELNRLDLVEDLFILELSLAAKSGPRPIEWFLVMQFPQFEPQIRAAFAVVLSNPTLQFDRVRSPLQAPNASESLRQDAAPVPADQTQFIDAVPGYKIDRYLGAGSTGRVYHAISAAGQDVAIKVLNLQDDKQLLRRLDNEASLLAKLNHANIVQIRDTTKTKQGASCLILEYLPGGNLEAAVRANPPPPVSIPSIVLQLAHGIDAAHQHDIIHRDLKPSNVLLTADGQFKIADFGIAKLQGGTALTAPGDLVGTPLYMAPEQCTPNAAIDRRTDVYALGAIIFKLLTGKAPFEDTKSHSTADRIRTERPRLPNPIHRQCPDLAAICLKCLEKEPSWRYQTAAELALALENVAAQKPVGISSPSWIDRTRLWARLNPKPAIVFAILFLLSVALFGLSAILEWKWRQADQNAAIAQKNAIESAQNEAVAKKNEETIRQDRDNHIAALADLVTTFGAVDETSDPVVSMINDALKHLESFVANELTSDIAKLHLARMWYILGKRHVGLRDFDTAKTTLTRAIEYLDLVKNPAEQPQFRSLAGAIARESGYVLEHTDNAPAALRLYRTAWTWFDISPAAAFSDKYELLFWHLRLTNDIARTATTVGFQDEAVDFYRKNAHYLETIHSIAREIRTLAEKGASIEKPSETHLLLLYVDTLEGLGRCYAKQGQLTHANDDFADADSLLTAKMQANHPGDRSAPLMAFRLAELRLNAAMALSKSENQKLRLHWLMQSETCLRDASRFFIDELHHGYYRARWLALRGDVVEASRLADELASKETLPRERYFFAAKIYAVLQQEISNNPAARNGDILTTGLCRRRAISYLDVGRTSGIFQSKGEIEWMKRDPLFASLATTISFQEFVRNLESVHIKPRN